MIERSRPSLRIRWSKYRRTTTMVTNGVVTTDAAAEPTARSSQPQGQQARAEDLPEGLGGQAPRSPQRPSATAVLDDDHRRAKGPSDVHEEAEHSCGQEDGYGERPRSDRAE